MTPQPIATAPKGKRILVYCQRKATSEGWWEIAEYDEEIYAGWLDDAVDGEILLVQPTYWLPLPPLPTPPMTKQQLKDSIIECVIASDPPYPTLKLASLVDKIWGQPFDGETEKITPVTEESSTPSCGQDLMSPRVTCDLWLMGKCATTTSCVNPKN